MRCDEGRGEREVQNFLSVKKQRGKGHCYRLENSEITHLATNGHIFVLFYIVILICVLSLSLFHFLTMLSHLCYEKQSKEKGVKKKKKKRESVRILQGNDPCKNRN